MPRPVDVSVVIRHKEARLGPLLDSLLVQTAGTRHLALLVRRVCGSDGIPRALADLRRHLAPRFGRFELAVDPSPCGAPAAHNANLALGRAGLCLLLDPDLTLAPDALERLDAEAAVGGDDVAAWEPRRLPRERAADYDPASGQRLWCDGAALLLRRAAFEAVGGFDPRLAAAGADVDLSWRLRAAGFRLLYAPRAVVSAPAGPQGGDARAAAVLANLSLRARHGGPWRVAAGLLRYLPLLVAPGPGGSRCALLRVLPRFLAALPALARGPRARAQASFRGWRYGPSREGAGLPLPARHAAAAPRVSVLVRTVGRRAVLREALRSVARQTYPNLEVVVVEDGPPASAALVEETLGPLGPVYRATQARVGRCAAGNLALSLATGRYLTFLDDDDLLYADHVETLVRVVLGADARAAFALALEAPARPERADPGSDAEGQGAGFVVHRGPFSRPRLWQRNYLPIQSVLFHRSLYESMGGFDPAIEQLEDWDLWVRYSLAGDFAYVPKVTSRYRVPADPDLAARRDRAMARHVGAVRRRQLALLDTLPPGEAVPLRAALERGPGAAVAAGDALRRLLFASGAGRALYGRLRDAYRQVALGGPGDAAPGVEAR